MLNKINIGGIDSNGDVVKNVDDLVLALTNTNCVPFLVFPEGFIDKKTILTESVPNHDASVSTYSDDVNIGINPLCNVNSKVAGLYSLYFISGIGHNYVTSLPPIQTLNDTFFKNKDLSTKAKSFPANYDFNTNSESLLLTNDTGVAALPTPAGNFGDTLTIKTIAIPGMKFFSLVDTFKEVIPDGTLDSHGSFLSMLEIDTSIFTDWNTTNMPLYTLVQKSNGAYDLAYVGPQDVDKFYIPLQ